MSHEWLAFSYQPSSFVIQRRSATGSPTSATTLTLTLRAVTAAHASHGAPRAAQASRLTPGNEASPWRWPPWTRKGCGRRRRSHSARRPAWAARTPRAWTRAARLAPTKTSGRRKVNWITFLLKGAICRFSWVKKKRNVLSMWEESEKGYFPIVL